jgi:putative SOS response-associated peptidase YedK
MCGRYALHTERLTYHPVSQRVNHASQEGMDLIESVTC